MIGFIISIVLFNFVAFTTIKKLSINQIVHIWLFTISFQAIADLYVDIKFHGYWYFSKEIDWKSVPSIVLLVPPVNLIFLNWFPFSKSRMKQFLYFLYWLLFMISYELLTLLPEPMGYFHYGWWSIKFSAFIDPILLLILLLFYKAVCKMEKSLLRRMNNQYVKK